MFLANDLIECLNRALTSAGRADDGWNLRLRNAIDTEGLTMIPEADAPYLLGINDWVRAPHAYGTHQGWPAETAVVVKAKLL